MPDTAELDRLVRLADPAAGREPVVPDPLTVLHRPERTGRRRYAIAASALAVVVVAALVVLASHLVPDRGRQVPGSPNPGGSGGPRPAPSSMPATQRAPTPAPSTPPAGQATSASPTSGDHTAYSGPQHARAMRLLQAIAAAVPASYSLPPLSAAEPTPTSTAAPPPASYQAVHDEGPFPGWTGWYYDANLDVTRNGRTGTVGVKVWTKIPAWSANPCVLLSRFYWVPGSCTAVTVAGKQVAVSRQTVQSDAGPSGFDYRADEWATYRTPDGTVVMILQARHAFLPQTPPLPTPVFNTAQLTALALDPRFAS
jgi:hypothetical protein